MQRTGIISQKDSGIESIVEWSIKDFLSLPHPFGVYYESPLFSFAHESWFLKIYPNGRRWIGTEGFIDLLLHRVSSGPGIKVEVTLGVKTVDGKLNLEQHFTKDFDDSSYCGGSYNIIDRSLLRKRKLDLLPSGTLTLVCRIKGKGINEGASSNNIVSTKCSYCNKTLSVREDIQCHLRKCEDLPIKCQKCGEDVALKNWYDHKCQMANSEDKDALCQDFKKMLLDGQNHDLTLKVRSKELRAHQNVLKARCPVFQSMLNHDTVEKKRGVIDIPDCDPHCMEQFLFYVYCGKVETLDEKNMLGVYYVADKYDMRDLKQKCCDFIKESLSYTNICEVIQLALTHSDEGLLEHATKYFIDNTGDILLCVEWQNFMKDNPTVANELLIKCFRRK